MSRSHLVILSFLAAGCLCADPVYTYTATSVSFGEGNGADSMSASGPGLSNFGGGGRDISGGGIIVSPGAELAVAVGFNTSAQVTAGGIVDFGGISGSTNATGSVSAGSSVIDFVVPPIPNSIYVFAAQAIGQFTAVPVACGSQPFPPCDVSANILIDLPGTITISFTDPNPAFGGRV